MIEKEEDLLKKKNDLDVSFKRHYIDCYKGDNN